MAALGPPSSPASRDRPGARASRDTPARRALPVEPVPAPAGKSSPLPVEMEHMQGGSPPGPGSFLMCQMVAAPKKWKQPPTYWPQAQVEVEVAIRFGERFPMVER